MSNNQETITAVTEGKERVDFGMLYVYGISAIVFGAILAALVDVPIVKALGSFIGITGFAIYLTGVVSGALTVRTKN